jgi:hypothetical protein
MHNQDVRPRYAYNFLEIDWREALPCNLASTSPNL